MKAEGNRSPQGIGTPQQRAEEPGGGKGRQGQEPGDQAFRHILHDAAEAEAEGADGGALPFRQDRRRAGEVQHEAQNQQAQHGPGHEIEDGFVRKGGSGAVQQEFPRRRQVQERTQQDAQEGGGTGRAIQETEHFGRDASVLAHLPAPRPCGKQGCRDCREHHQQGQDHGAPQDALQPEAVPGARKGAEYQPQHQGGQHGDRRIQVQGQGTQAMSFKSHGTRLPSGSLNASVMPSKPSSAVPSGTH